MAAVASNHGPESGRGMDEQSFEHNSSRFTAVNGQGSPVSTNREPPVMGGDGPRNGVPTTGGDEDFRDVIGIPQTSSAPRQGALPVAPTAPVQQGQPAQAKQERPPSSTIDRYAPYGSLHGENLSRSPVVRKRSFPEAFGEPNNGPQPSNAHRTHTDALEYNRGPSGPYSHATSKLPPNHEIDPDRRQPRLSREFDPHAQPTQPYYAQPPMDEEARLAEALRENGMGNVSRDSFASPDSDEQQRLQYGVYGANDRAAHAEAERKRRKRVFSNRTKTGCLTCRKRKKKCDELHPECNNCLRGGFVCEGYSVRNAWQKPTPSKTPIPLQSKNGYGTPGPQQPPNYYPEVSPEYTPGSSNPNGSENKPIYAEEERRTHPNVSSPSQERRNQNGWPREERQYQNHPSAQLYHEMDRPSTAQNEAIHDVPDPLALYPSTTAHPSQNLQISRASVPTSQSAPAVAQAALQNPILTQRPSGNFQTELTEREKMLRGEYYLPYTPALMKDREQCAAAVWRFNNSTNPTTGISYEERTRFFKAILSLRPTPEPAVPGQENRETDPTYLPVGSVGPGVTVEAPFHCDYGYNITIGSHVTIAPDCRITDTCAVTIGNNVVFSPGVKLVCTTYGIDPRERRKGKGRALGRNIIIEDDCWIGSNVSITPGVRVGRSSTVGAGSLICKDVPPYTVVAGNPQKVVRGIYDGH